MIPILCADGGLFCLGAPTLIAYIAAGGSLVGFPAYLWSRLRRTALSRNAGSEKGAC